MKVSNMTNAKGNKIANQFIIEDCIIPVENMPIDALPLTGTMFQSYDSNIAFIPCSECMGTVKAFLDRNTWDYSNTTGKYRNMFLGETKKETQKKIDSSEYKLVNLN